MPSKILSLKKYPKRPFLESILLHPIHHFLPNSLNIKTNHNMTEVIHFPSPSSSSSSSTCVTNDIPLQQQPPSHRYNPTSSIPFHQQVPHRPEAEREVSVVELLVAVFRRSVVGCSVAIGSKELCNMEIGVPTNVRHVNHVTFDRFNGFLGLPVEFEPEVPRRPPSASATVFGVSTESMQLSYDTRGNSVPTILLMMQRHFYAQGGLQAEGIFRINADNSQEEYVRDQLNNGVIPEDIDVHCLAGLIKAWFRELPTGVLDSLSPEQVMQSQTEEECARLARLLPPTEAALLDWAINLMADVAQFGHLNKMNARNIAMVFAPNMTHMSDPLTALMYAVQVMNFLKTLIVRTLREREDSAVDSNPLPRVEPSDENDHPSSHLSVTDGNEEETSEDEDEDEDEKGFIYEDLSLESPQQPPGQEDSSSKKAQTFLTSIENIPGGTRSLVDSCDCDVVSQFSTFASENQESSSACKTVSSKIRKSRTDQSSNSNVKKGSTKPNDRSVARAASPVEKSKGSGILGRTNQDRVV